MEPRSDDARQRLATTVARERSLRGLPVSKAAALANMSHVTWMRIENGQRVQSGKLGAVDRVFRWPSGTAEAVLAGEDPPLPDPRIVEIMRSTVFSDEEKEWLVAALPPRQSRPDTGERETG